MPRKPTGRRRGGQLGNHNRLKHGLYSRHLLPPRPGDSASAPLASHVHELALARVRLKTCIEQQLTAPPEEWLIYERAIAHYLGLVTSLIYRNARRGSYSERLLREIAGLAASWSGAIRTSFEPLSNFTESPQKQA